MKINQISNFVNFNGKIHVTAVKNEKWKWYDFITSKTTDNAIKNMAEEFLPHNYDTSRTTLSEKIGKKFKELLDNSIGEKLDIPDNSAYSTKVSENHILLFCEEKGKLLQNDRTAIDIYL